ncbi:MAG: GTP cyclohydrolase I, partial [Candidatus Limnocylindria bacterium]
MPSTPAAGTVRGLPERDPRLAWDGSEPARHHRDAQALPAALIDATDGYDGDPKLVTVFPTECHGDASCELAQIVEGPIPFFALCEHHALPFFGQAYAGYVAHDQIIGIS